jgi:hypothetical protein
MHALFAPFGSMPNNAIVGGSGDIAVGAALFKRINRRPGIVLANIGDASSACGPVWEGIVVSARDQYRTLWDKKLGGAPPILFNFFNNFYGMGGQPEGETMGFRQLRAWARGSIRRMHAERWTATTLAGPTRWSARRDLLEAAAGAPGRDHLPADQAHSRRIRLLPHQGSWPSGSRRCLSGLRGYLTGTVCRGRGPGKRRRGRAPDGAC